MTQVRVKVLTQNQLEILGKIRTSLLTGDYSANVSDLLNNSRSFIELIDVEVYSQGQLLTQMESLCINKPAITLLCEQ